MNKLFIVLFITISFSSSAQTVFSNAFTAELPGPLLAVNGQLYVGTIFNGALYKVDINNPNVPILVAEGFIADGPWKLGYDPLNNNIYVRSLSLPSFSKIDLDLNLPITVEQIEIPGAQYNGFTINDNLIYLTDGDNIYTYDITVGVNSYQLFYTDTGFQIRNPRIHNNELYYFTGNAPNSNAYKINLSDPNLSKVLVSSNLPGIVQSSLVVGNYIYLGVEASNKLIKLDLTSSLPIEHEVVLENPDGPLIGLANLGNTFFASEFNTRNIITFKDQALTIDDLNLSSTRLYPNPVEELLYIKHENSIASNYSIYSINGAKIKEGIYVGEIDVSNLTSGLYFIHLEQNGVSQIEKFVKK